eukprot:1893694-Pleurochrysis_carterae.AAC.1
MFATCLMPQLKAQKLMARNTKISETQKAQQPRSTALAAVSVCWLQSKPTRSGQHGGARDEAAR